MLLQNYIFFFYAFTKLQLPPFLQLAKPGFFRETILLPHFEHCHVIMDTTFLYLLILLFIKYTRLAGNCAYVNALKNFLEIISLTLNHLVKAAKNKFLFYVSNKFSISNQSIYCYYNPANIKFTSRRRISAIDI